MDWLKQALSDSPCAFKVILNSVPIMGFTDVWPELMDRWQAFLISGTSCSTTAIRASLLPNGRLPHGILWLDRSGRQAAQSGR